LKHKIALLAGPLLAGVVLFGFDLDPANPLVTRMAAVTIWMAVWWLTEPVHLAVTALIPFVLMPVFGVADVQTTANQYMDPVMFLFIGGFLLAFAIERWNLHKRISLVILSKVGNSPASILLGVMLAAWFLSMWISNTATVMMLLGATLAIVKQLDEHIDEPKARQKAGSAVMMGLAFAATIGGMASLVGTPPNMIFYRAYMEQYPQNQDMSFSIWMSFGLPISAVFIVLTWFVLKRGLLKRLDHIQFDRTVFQKMRKELGVFQRDEKVVSVIFVITILLWFTRAGFQFGSVQIPGWTAFLGEFGKNIQDSTIGIFMALILFFIPSHSEPQRTLLTWSEARELPFDIVLLFGSGFALAKGFEVSGLSQWLAQRLMLLSDAPVWLIVLVIAMVVTLISEFASNVASIQLALPILISLQTVIHVHPLVLMIPATLAASLGFMLPVATAPNTIVFGTGRIKVVDMMRVGILLDAIGIVLILIFGILYNLHLQ
jgi:solute carrier family 13 (sodium-dependent dicarboxylate transporter), member 2/3/5